MIFVPILFPTYRIIWNSIPNNFYLKPFLMGCVFSAASSPKGGSTRCDAWFVFVMRHASWFAHRVYEKKRLIRVDVSFVHSSHLVRQLGGKLTHQSKLYVSESANLFDTFTHDTPRIRIMHRVDPALVECILLFQYTVFQPYSSFEPHSST